MLIESGLEVYYSGVDLVMVVIVMLVAEAVAVCREI